MPPEFEWKIVPVQNHLQITTELSFCFFFFLMRTLYFIKSQLKLKRRYRNICESHVSILSLQRMQSHCAPKLKAINVYQSDNILAGSERYLTGDNKVHTNNPQIIANKILAQNPCPVTILNFKNHDQIRKDSLDLLSTVQHSKPISYFPF